MTYAYTHRFVLPVLFGLFFFVFACGCDKSSTLGARVTGTVTWDEQPLADGQIVFLDKQNSDTSSGKIANGQFTVDLTPGEKIVRITATKVVGKTRRDPSNPNSEEVDRIEQFLPAVYNTKSTLTANVAEKNEPLTFQLQSTP